jgi:hypothetical protein
MDSLALRSRESYRIGNSVPLVQKAIGEAREIGVPAKINTVSRKILRKNDL